MFGKFLLTVAVIAIVWFGFKYLARVAEIKHRDASPAAPKPRRDSPLGGNAETMVECRVCGTWQPARSAKPCGKANCPY